MTSIQDERECWFTPSRFRELLEREQQWFEILMRVGLGPGASPAYQVRMMLVERTRWLRN
jgi:hypothetical protein